MGKIPAPDFSSFSNSADFEKKGKKLYHIERPSFFPIFPDFDSFERKISLDKESYSLITAVPPENLYLFSHFSQSQNTSTKVA